MKFEISRDIESRVFSVQVDFKEYGNESLSAEAELEVYKDFGFPKVDVGGAFKSDPADPDSDTIFVLNKKEVEVNQGFSAKYSVKIDSLEGADEDTKISIAAGRCDLFEMTLLKRLEDKLAEVQRRASSFSDGYPKETII